MKCLWHVPFQVKRSKVKVTGVIWNFCCVSSVPIWSICFVLGANIVHDVTICCDPFPGPKVKGQDHCFHLKWRSHWLLEVFAVPWLCPYLAKSLYLGIHKTHQRMMCHKPFSGWKVKGQGHMGRSNFYRVHSVALSLFQRLTSYEIHTQPMRSQCVSHHFRVKRSTKVKVTQVIWSFCCVRSMASPYLTESLHMWHIYNT